MFYSDSALLNKCDLCTVAPDVLLLTHFVANSKSLRANDHNWVPLCMPDFNSKGFLQVGTVICTSVAVTEQQY